MRGFHTTNSAQTYLSTICNPPGSHYSFRALCQWRTNGVAYSKWVSSPWVKDRARLRQVRDW